MEPFLGEIRLFSFGFSPAGWAKCDGALLQIQQNNALYALLGTQFGGDGRTTFALPDLRGRTPLAAGNGGGGVYAVGNKGGVDKVTLTISQMPAHSHSFCVTDTVGNQPNVGSNTDQFLLATPAGGQKTPRYGDLKSLQPMAAGTVASAGGSQPHNNLQPYLTLNACIATVGIFPPRY